LSSKADDFDVRSRDRRDGAAGADGPDGGQWNYDGAGHGVLGGTVDYDLGYDANGWDTQGFRSPTAGYLDNRDAVQPGPAQPDAVRPGRPNPDAVRPGPADRGTARPAAASQDTAYLDPAPRPADGRGGSHARTAGAPAAEALSYAPDGPGSADPWLPGQPVPGQPAPGERPGRRGRRGDGGPPRRGLPPVKVKGSWWRHWTWRKVLGLVLAIIGAFVIIGAVGVAVAYEETPVPTDALAATAYSQSVVYSANGTLIGRFGTTNRQELSYDQIPQSMINAVLSAEDRGFWSEGGISPTAIARAAYADVSSNGNSLQGGSTITQQFVRNYYAGIGTQQTFSRKIKEIFVAMKIAKGKSKQWILQNYLNTIFLGEGAYGVQAASETYFGKPVGQLTEAQDAVIAALIQQPSTYPLPQYRAQLEARWQYVLDGMVTMGNLSAQQAAAMKFPKLGDNVPQSFGPNVWDPYVMYMVEQELEQVYNLSQQQIYNGGYVIKTSIDNAKMAQLYSAVSQNEAQIDNSSVPFESYMHVGAVLENPADGAIDALYPGPGEVGSKYNGTGPVITAKQCREINCDFNMAYQNREQVGSSFKPYILSAAVKEGMNVKTSTLDGYDNLYIPPDTEPNAYATTTQVPESHIVLNDDAGENGPYTPQIAMAASINTAYADLWHKAAGQGNETQINNVGEMARLFGVDTAEAGITGKHDFQDQYGVALGVASLTVIEQGSMLATIDDNGVYHDPHLVTSITRNNVPTPIKITSYQVFSSNNPTLNAEMDSQVQYAMSEDTASYGTAPSAALSNGQPIIAKTGTTEDAQSAFFVGAIPSQALTVALFTSDQNDCTTQVSSQSCQTLNNLGDAFEGGYGGTWPAAIWHTYAENEFVPLGIEAFQPAVFTGQTWNLVPPGQRVVATPQKSKKATHGQSATGRSSSSGGGNGNTSGGNPNPFPTYSCDPSVVTCDPNAPAG
jgi:membrane peptidoglycan carboxypeptidase